MQAISIKSDAAEISSGIRNVAKLLGRNIVDIGTKLNYDAAEYFRNLELNEQYKEHYRRRFGYGLQSRTGDTYRKGVSYLSIWSGSNWPTFKITVKGNALVNDTDRTIRAKGGGWMIFPGDDAVDSRGVLKAEFSGYNLQALREAGKTFWMPTRSPNLAFIGYKATPGDRVKRIRVAAKEVFIPKRTGPEQHFTFWGGANGYFDELAGGDFVYRAFHYSLQDAGII